MSIWESVHLGKCPSRGGEAFGKMSIQENVLWGNSFCENVYLWKCPLGKCLRENVIKPIFRITNPIKICSLYKFKRTHKTIGAVGIVPIGLPTRPNYNIHMSLQKRELEISRSFTIKKIITTKDCDFFFFKEYFNDGTIYLI